MMDKSCVEWKPKYFDESVDDAGIPKYDFNGLYWEERER